MCKFAKNLLKIVAVVAFIAGVAAVVFHFLQKKEAMVDETLDSLDNFVIVDDPAVPEEELEEPAEPKVKKSLRWESRKRSYIKLPFHEA